MKNYLSIIILLFSVIHAYGHVTLISPKGGETLTVGKVTQIEWEETIPHETQNWDLLFSSDGGQNWDTLQANISVDANSFSWVVPETVTTQGRIQIIQDNSGFDYFDISADITIQKEEVTTGIEETEVAAIQIYPNPTSDKLQLTGLSPAIIELYNTSGQLLESRKSRSNEVLFNLVKYASGVYYFNIITTKSNRTYKVVKD